VRHLPQGFVYHRHRVDEDHWFELMAEINAANETLLRICCGLSSETDEAARIGKRRRISAEEDALDGMD